MDEEINAKLEYLDSTKDILKESIVNSGGTLSTQSPLSDYPEQVNIITNNIIKAEDVDKFVKAAKSVNTKYLNAEYIDNYSGSGDNSGALFISGLTDTKQVYDEINDTYINESSNFSIAYRGGSGPTMEYPVFVERNGVRIKLLMTLSTRHITSGLPSGSVEFSHIPYIPNSVRDSIYYTITSRDSVIIENTTDLVKIVKFELNPIFDITMYTKLLKFCTANYHSNSSTSYTVEYKTVPANGSITCQCFNQRIGTDWYLFPTSTTPYTPELENNGYFNKHSDGYYYVDNDSLLTMNNRLFNHVVGYTYDLSVIDLEEY